MGPFLVRKARRKVIKSSVIGTRTKWGRRRKREHKGRHMFEGVGNGHELGFE